MTSNQKSDIIVLGATGFTGRLITRYLASHPQFSQGLFTFSIAARSQSKLHTLVQELSLSPKINTIQVDVTNYSELESVVKSAKVIINTVGPYWRWGTPVVRYVTWAVYILCMLLVNPLILEHVPVMGSTMWI